MPDESRDDADFEGETDRDGSNQPDSMADKIGFTLPPITLPPLRLPSLALPEDFSPIPPTFERVRGSANLPLAALAIDCIDVLVVLVVGGGLARVTIGTILAIGLVYPLGVLYAWELLPVLGGVPGLGVIPSATLVVLADRYRSRIN